MKKILYTLLIALTLLASFSLYRNVHAAVIGAIPFNPSNSNNTLTKGLVGYWTFDGKDVVNGVAMDKSGNGNSGNLINIATSTFYALGKIGQAFKLNGVNNEIKIPPSTSLNVSSAITVMMWVKGFPQPAGNIYIARYNSPSNDRAWTMDNVNAVTGRLEVKISDDGTFNSGHSKQYSISDGTGALNGVWHLIGFTFNGNTSTLSLYQDGIVDNNVTKSTDDPITSIYTAPTKNIEIGSINGGQNFFNGTVDDVRIYNRALSAGEISQLYSMGSTKYDTSQKVNSGTGLSNGLVGYWTFDGKDVINGAIQDDSGNGNVGNLQSISTSTFYVSGKIGQAFNFDGASNWISLPTALSLNNITSQSICAWVKTSAASGTGYIYSSKTVAAGGVSLAILTGKPTLIVKTTVASSANTSVADGLWHLVCATFASSTPSSQINYYLDGVSDGVTTSSAIVGFGNSKRIGATNNGGVGSVFKGIMDDVRIYGRVLSPNEVSQLYSMGSTKYDTSPKVNSGTGLSNGLVGYWTFDGKDVVNGVAMDKGGNGDNLNLMNIATSTFYALGKIGQAFDFDGINDYTFGNFSNYESSDSSGSISLWFKSSSNSGFQTFFSSQDSTGQNQFWLHLYNGAIKLETEIGGTISTIQTVGTGFRDNKWHHLVLLCNGSTYSIYVDGTSQSLTGTNNGIWFSSIPSRISISVGNYKAGATLLYYFNGSLDDVRIYNRALSTTEIRQLYNIGR